MRIIYLGTPDFSVLPLKSILDSGKHQVVAVVTNKDKPVGRKKVLTAPPVKVFATEKGIPVYQYDKIRLEGVEDMKKLNPDIMITCAFGQILSQELIDIAKYGVINIHASLLPKYRGASPIHYAILNGEEKTGISIMKTDIGIDTGDVILQKEIEIGREETCGELFERLSVLGAESIIEALSLIESGNVHYQKQDESKATLTKIIKKENALIDWTESAEKICNKVRAFNPAPVAYCMLNGLPFKVYKAEIAHLKGEAGKILRADSELIIGCGDGSVALKIVQKAGGNAMQIGDFLRGNKFTVGEDFN
ncbi:MAG: methionyl-tRNA formyltransferase [Clostridia bacterium]|nr:methionyl-tRNA formyltransferase [Clostridia bacterium]